MERKNISTHGLCLMLVFLLIFSLVLCNTSAFAETSVKEAYEATNVLDELQGSTIGGDPFDIEEYPADTTGSIDIQILSFVEFGFAYDVASRSDFDLYVLVYNPTQQVIDPNGANQIQMSYGTSQQDKFPLQILNYSEKVGCEGRFYKFKIVLSRTDRFLMFSELNTLNRVYSVTGIELQVSGEIIDHKVTQTYEYTGFAKGYGSPHMTQSTLGCTVTGFEKYVELGVHHTYYRAMGDYYEGEQSQINSCYFRVPERFFKNFGSLTEVLCQWYEYVTKPILVTQTKSIYQNLYNLHGGSVNDFSDILNFMILAYGNISQTIGGADFTCLGWTSNYPTFYDEYVFSGSFGGAPTLDIYNLVASGLRFNNFAAVFYTGDNVSFRDKSVSSEEVLEQLLYNSAHLGGSLIAGRYSEQLFESDVENGHIRGLNKKSIKATDDVDYFWNITTKSFWQSLFGGFDVDTKWDFVKAIVPIEEADLLGSNSEIAARLLVSESDVDSIKEEYSLSKSNNEHLILMRFGNSTYHSLSCSESIRSKADSTDRDLVYDVLYNRKYAGYTAYMARETVYLNFDIISLFFTLNDVTTEIPVVSNPTDAISSISPPLKEDYHQGNTLGVILAIILLVLAAIIVIIVFRRIHQSRASRSKVTVNLNEASKSDKKKSKKTYKKKSKKSKKSEVKTK